MRAVILCGGLGKRLRPLTNNTPKAMIPLRGKPIIENTVRTLYHCGIKQIIVVTGYLGHQIKEFLRDGHEFNVRITYVNQEQSLGSADALDLTRNLCSPDFLVTSCDIVLSRRHIESLIRSHMRWKSPATLSLVPLGVDQILSMNTVTVGSNNRIFAILEKPSFHEIMGTWSATSLYVFNKCVFDFLTMVQKSPRSELEISSAIDMMIRENLPVRYVTTRSWLHMSTLDDFLGLNNLRMEHSKKN